MKKLFVLDTNVLLSDPNAIFSFDNNVVVIPTVVLQELDKKKVLMDEVGRNARHFARLLDDLRKQGKLHEGVKLENGGLLKVAPPPVESRVYDNFLSSEADNKIIATAKILMEQMKNKVIVVSKDVNVRIKADVENIGAEDYENDKVISSSDDQYAGFKTVDSDAHAISISKKNSFSELSSEGMLENEFYVLKNGSQEEIAINKKNKIHKLYNYPNNSQHVFGLKARNTEQAMALELLLDDSIPLVTLSGKAGTGKTLLALATALHKVQDEQKYKKVSVARPVVPMGKDIGYLPGEMEEKLRPWMQPIYDNLEFLFDCKDQDELNKLLVGYEEIVSVEALTYIRGRSIPDQFIIIDEAQNLTKHEAKTILTRVGERSKIVLVGDPHQIDHPYLDQYSNGLTYVIEKMKHLQETGHVLLSKGERSNLAQLCADML
ncbi:PhoH family protein [Alkalihalophilus pseudofirmus]|uniref:PhoH family protein n=1 Tax=Alkalihalophilus pseudofirmus TaxID=79885 RepID=UPI00259B2A25|nr:PhoH family protein [Alkalihalophilus pseudofirmus]WEG18517.1 PhoH family protein [Alkalihalophilus pseudofirmus]